MSDDSIPSINIAAVVPRYGASIGGGAETLVRDLFLSLRDTPVKMEVLTTCAMDHRTWENILPEGDSFEDGICIKRFRVSDRNLEVFIKAEQKLQQGFMLSGDEQISWLENSVNSRSLYEYLYLHAKSYDYIFYAPYLFGTTFWGSVLSPENAILIPCLHDEAYAYLPVMRYMFRQVLGIMWNAEPEAILAKAIYRLPELGDKGHVVGMGFDLLPQLDFVSLHDKPYLLYSGRKETGKNLDYLISCYQEYRAESSAPLDLVLIGSGKIDFLDSLPEGVIDKGFVSEDEKRLFLMGASLFIQPSTNESFSIVIMEAWREAVPVLVHADCAVTSYHVKRSEGGLWFRSVKEFIAIVKQLETDTEIFIEMGKKGKKFVSNEYSREAVLKRFLAGFEIWGSPKWKK
jgi:glycosyltransferase involved in cell wall biosynthesis